MGRKSEHEVNIRERRDVVTDVLAQAVLDLAVRRPPQRPAADQEKPLGVEGPLRRRHARG